MPIYEYRCGACGHEFDELQKLADAPLVDCPNCGKPALIKKVSAAGFQLRGTGWYATDFKGSKKKEESRKEEGSAAKAEPVKAETKTEIKTDTKTLTKADAPATTKAAAKPGDA